MQLARAKTQAKTALLNATSFCSPEARPGKWLSCLLYTGLWTVQSGTSEERVQGRESVEPSMYVVCSLLLLVFGLLVFLCCKSGPLGVHPVRSAPLIASAPEGGALQGAR